MKLLTINFLQCPSKPCKADPASAARAFPLQPVACELVRDDAIPFNGALLRGLLAGRVEWAALTTVASELGFTLPATAPEPSSIVMSLDTPSPSSSPPRVPRAASSGEIHVEDAPMQDADAPEGDSTPSPSENAVALTRRLWEVLVETRIDEGVLRCRGCGHEYKIKEGIGGFLLPAHLV